MKRHTTPVLLVCGVDEGAMLSATISLQFGVPDAVVMRHVIDPVRQVLVRTVSDVSGVIEKLEIDLQHACVSCAIREDIVPTLERLAADGRWGTVIACLPVTAEPTQVCRVIAWAPRNSPHIRISAVVATLDGETLAGDLLGDDLVDERGLATSAEDRRGVAEVACAMVEYADAVCLTTTPGDEEADLVTALARPGTPVVADPSLLDAAALVAGLHQPDSVEAWVAEVRREDLTPLPASRAWRLDLRSDRPMHPDRLNANVEILGGGPRRSRGCFWLPTRPLDICVWEGAGGQVSVGATTRWTAHESPLTRLVIIGLDEDAGEIADCFAACLLTDAEIATRGRYWEQTADGLEPWLGPIHRAA